MKALLKLLEEQSDAPTITLRDRKLLAEIHAYVEANYSRSSLSVVEISQAMGISRVHLYKRMLALLGVTPVEYIRYARLEHAAKMLKESRRNVSEIAYMVGFNNPKYFSKYFKDRYNALPTVYRNMP